MIGVRRYAMLIKGKELDSASVSPGVLLRQSGIIRTYDRDIMT